MLAAFLAFAAAALAPNNDGPGPFPPTHGPDSVQPGREALDLDYEGKAKALRAEMRMLKESDGGQLTVQHRTYLQGKLRALVSAYHRDVQRIDPMSVNADGSKPR